MKSSLRWDKHRNYWKNHGL